MLWRGSSIPKLRKVWSKFPYGDADCRLCTNDIEAYCLGSSAFGQLVYIDGERSGITDY